MGKSIVKSVWLSVRFLSESKGLPDPRLQDVDPEVSCSPKCYMYCADT